MTAKEHRPGFLTRIWRNTLLPLMMARRYLFSKKKHNAINIISAISVAGVAVGTMALVCTLSVFNGFRDLIGSLFTTFDPQIEVTAAKGKFISVDDPVLKRLQSHPDVAAASAGLEDHALILFRGRPTVVTIKGVDEKYDSVTAIRSILYGNGSYRLQAGDVNYGIPGIGLAAQMGGIDYGSLQICAPRKGERVNMANPTESFNAGDIISPGVCFDVNQRVYDESYLLVPLRFAQELFEQEGRITQLEIRLRSGCNEDRVKRELQEAAEGKFIVSNRFEQQRDVFNVMNIEKLMAYIFLTFILLVACFNIIGSVSMLIIDKRTDVETLRHLGASDRLVFRVFLYEGRAIALLGAVIGTLLGLLMCWLQQEYGLIRLGGASGSFIIDAYPVSVHWLDVMAVFATVIVVGFASVWYPVKFLSRRFLA